MSAFVDHLLNVPAPAAYAVIGALVFAEAALFIGFVLPGETAVLLGGVLTTTGWPLRKAYCATAADGPSS